ncbi:MAG: aminotransferase class I/II-fold pyridoxal phosphate-dependent enzyme [Gammaproteobacteria bacterium]|nr:aminotransferase class I/II-fold pyridoxal phosphate-dependent enzyme [Gammaproteobacteria bacterium]MBT8110513.1 aminotransferase class I/II-fold pyridoxal phosphate-dependent enzyme [Gammaproteobacteria bacterium]NND46391.1 aminotransferase class I/II-fold pyridoxal phosphate-dependent enzyme [Woeseiaceae bacterium]NNL45213.1 aminotransferase class I/II-fold pyridoxal phosphate-dependent enzyme [Woeseiaceae bacterium]
MTSNSKNKGISTKAIHAGEDRRSSTGASAPDLVMSSSFLIDEEVSFSATNLDADSPYIYTRWSNPTTAQLEEKLAALEQAEACIALASGMAATTAVLLQFLSKGDHLVISSTNYPGTAEFARQTLPRFGISVSPVDTREPEYIQNAIRSETKMVWLESPSNPLLRLADIAAAADIATQQGALLVVDSTFATPIASRPLELGADLVVHSLTKYMGGHGDAMGGSICGSRELISALRGEALTHYGGVISPFNAWLIMRGMATLPMRMRAHEENALAVVEFLQNHPRVEVVIYPGLDSHPQHELAKRQMDNFSGMVAFRVADAKQVAERMMSDLEVIHYAVSLGHHRSLIYLMQTEDLIESSYRLEGEELKSYRATAGDGLFRLSVGLEDAKDLCEDLGRVL